MQTTTPQRQDQPGNGTNPTRTGPSGTEPVPEWQVGSRRSGDGSVRLVGATRRYGQTAVVENVHLHVEPGELLAVVGPSGAGKTTLLRLVAGFERPDAGQVEVGGRIVAGPGVWVPPERRRVGLVFQDDALFPHLTAAGNVAFGLGDNRRGRRERVHRALALVGLAGHADRHPHELSGGERQRVALARALAPEPEVLLLDEPFSSQDAGRRAALRREVARILRAAGTTALLVTHDQEEALAIADRVAVVNGGRLVQVAAPEEAYARPADLWTAGFLGDVNVVDGSVRAGVAETPLGPFACPAGPSTRTRADVPPGGQDAGHPATADGPARVAVRPEQLELGSAAPGNATVTAKAFHGHDTRYQVLHDECGELEIRTLGVTPHTVGSRVTVHARPGSVATLVEPVGSDDR